MAYQSKYKGQQLDEAISQATDKLPSRISEAESKISHLQKNKADVNAIPKKLSQLTDDIGYETKEDALAKLTKAKAYTDKLKFDLEIGNVTAFSAETDLGGSAIHETYATKAELNAVLEDASDIKFVSIHDDIASIIPKDGELYVIKYHNMPARNTLAEPDENGEYPIVITDTIRYRVKIGDGKTSLSDLPVVSDFQAGEGIGSMVQIDSTYCNGTDSHNGCAQATGKLSFAQGKHTIASGDYSVAMNYSSEASGKRSFACNRGTAGGIHSFAANYSEATGTHSTAFGNSTANGGFSFVSGQSNVTGGRCSHAEGQNNTINKYAEASHAEGYNNTVTVKGLYAHAEGSDNVVNAEATHAQGKGNTVDGKYAHAEGLSNIASGEASHAGGYGNNISGNYSFVYGEQSVVDGKNSGSIGSSNKIRSNSSFAVGNNNRIGSDVGKHSGSFVAGTGNIVSNNNMTAFGRYNNPVASAPFVVGWGQGEDSRNNILELYRTGVLRVNTSHQTLEGDEATLQLGDTKLTETQLKDILNLRTEMNEIKKQLGDIAALQASYIGDEI